MFDNILNLINPNPKEVICPHSIKRILGIHCVPELGVVRYAVVFVTSRNKVQMWEMAEGDVITSDDDGRMIISIDGKLIPYGRVK